jgi:hypothetical protein
MAAGAVVGVGERFRALVNLAGNRASVRSHSPMMRALLAVCSPSAAVSVAESVADVFQSAINYQLSL